MEMTKVLEFSYLFVEGRTHAHTTAQQTVSGLRHKHRRRDQPRIWRGQARGASRSGSCCQRLRTTAARAPARGRTRSVRGSRPLRESSTMQQQRRTFWGRGGDGRGTSGNKMRGQEEKKKQGKKDDEDDDAQLRPVETAAQELA
ncbi:hypothetical protein CFAM422_000823 [Trichoderma lentiforme]|uniref:Uncharacterized protein n=1 Tax=Trichoderma lentiforme TaxID=1567552 RepID=A0A9P4XQU2_9HYPO|nr:hypothetical protein CFAM422_000823 [Trichoderma lentiforme]